MSPLLSSPLNVSSAFFRLKWDISLEPEISKVLENFDAALTHFFTKTILEWEFKPEHIHNTLFSSYNLRLGSIS
jgi:hypothetical protein